MSDIPTGRLPARCFRPPLAPPYEGGGKNESTTTHSMLSNSRDSLPLLPFVRGGWEGVEALGLLYHL